MAIFFWGGLRLFANKPMHTCTQEQKKPTVITNASAEINEINFSFCSSFARFCLPISEKLGSFGNKVLN